MLVLVDAVSSLFLVFVATKQCGMSKQKLLDIFGYFNFQKLKCLHFLAEILLYFSEDFREFFFKLCCLLFCSQQK